MHDTCPHLLIVEDHPETARWLSDVLVSLYETSEVVLAGDLASARDCLASRTFQIVLLDLNLPDGSGVDLIAACRERSEDVLIVVTTLYDDDDSVFRALRAGADGYLLKTEGDAELAQKLAGITRGEVPISPAIARRMLAFFSELRPLAGTRENSDKLTPREREVLFLIAQGFSRKECARMCMISVNTVSEYAKKAYGKLGLRNRAEAATLLATRPDLKP